MIGLAGGNADLDRRRRDGSATRFHGTERDGADGTCTKIRSRVTCFCFVGGAAI